MPVLSFYVRCDQVLVNNKNRSCDVTGGGEKRRGIKGGEKNNGKNGRLQEGRHHNAAKEAIFLE